MQLTAEQVLALAPDDAAAAAARKLAASKAWRGLSRSARAMWGECQGSAVYQVRVDLADLTTRCSCPSRKFPCKHALGLLLVAAAQPAALADAAEPEWVSEWLAKRAVTAERKEARAAEKPKDAAPADPAAQAKRAAQRMAKVAKGIDALELWLCDRVRQGLAGLEREPPSFFEQQAARLVDAQAPGLAARVRRLAFVPGPDPRWPARMLDELGKLLMLAHAFRRLDALSPGLRADVRQMIGFTLDKDEVAATGEHVVDEWVLVAQSLDEDDRLRAERSWLVGTRTGRSAMVLQFAVGTAPFAETMVAGTAFEAELAYWPSAAPQRALVHARRGQPRAFRERFPGHDSIAAMLDAVADAVARQPWLDRFGAVLRGVVPVPSKDGRWLRDAAGAAVRLAPGDPWPLFALSGGAPIDVAGEWDGERLLPLAASDGGEYHALTRGRA